MKQTIPPHTITPLVDRPDVAVVQRSEGDSWVEVNPDGSLLFGPCEGLVWEWEAFVQSGHSALLTAASTEPPTFSYRE